MSSKSTPLLYSAAEAYVSLGLQLMSMVIFSRLLSPAEIGMFAVAVSVTTVGSAVRDFGVGEYLIQSRKITAHRIRVAGTLNIITSWGIGLLIALCAAPIAHFYGNWQVRDLLWVLSMNFVIMPFGAIGMAYFRRELNMRPMFMATLLSGILGLVVSLYLIYRDSGVFALAWGSFASMVVTVCVSIWYRPSWFPSTLSLRGVRPMAKFGLQTLGIYVLHHLQRATPDLTNARLLGVHESALMSRGLALGEIITRLALKPIDALCLPYLANARRNDGSVNKTYGQIMTHVSGIIFPSMCLMYFSAPSLIPFAFGAQWTPSVVVAKIVLIGLAFDAVHYYAREVLISIGRVALAVRLQWFALFLRLFGLAMGAQFGLEGSAYGYVISCVACFAMSGILLKSEIGFGVLSNVRSLWQSVAVTVCVYAALYAFESIAPTDLSIIQKLIGLGAVAAVGYLVPAFALGHPTLKLLASTVNANPRLLGKTLR